MRTATDQRREIDAVSFAQYRAQVSRSVVPLDLRAPDPDAFRGALDATDVGDIHLLKVTAPEHSVHRTCAHITRSPESYLKFTLVEQGGGLLIQDGREGALTAGDMAVYDTSRPYSLLFDEAVRLTIVMFPQTLLDIPQAAIGTVTGQRLSASAEVQSVVRPFLSALAGASDDLTASVERRLLRNAVDMVGTLLRDTIDQTVGPTTRHAELVERILGHIDEHLTDPDLDPGRIAAAHFISVRHLHGLFHDQRTTVSTVIRLRRLQRCYDDLTDPGQIDRSVATIAQANGFVDAAHFSRAFRSHFGVPPSEVRPSS